MVAQKMASKSIGNTFLPHPVVPGSLVSEMRCATVRDSAVFLHVLSSNCIGVLCSQRNN